MSQIAILVVDPDSQYLDIVDGQTTKAIVSIPTISDEAALSVLKDPSVSLRGIFINSSLPNYSWVQVVQDAILHRPGAPVYLYRDNDDGIVGLDDGEILEIGVQKILSRPESFSQMVKIVNPILVGFDTKQALEIVTEANEDSDDKEFRRIRADNFLSGSLALFDVYLPISTTKKIKLCSKGGKFEEARVAKYIDKGVTHFLIPKEAQKAYLNFCQHLTDRILKRKDISSAVKISQTLNMGDQTMSFLKENQIGEEEINYAKEYIGHTESLLKQVSLKDHKVLAHFLAHTAGYEHGVATAMIASIFSKSMGFGETYGADTLGLAALLHDIGLSAIGGGLEHEDPSLMSGEELEAFHKHPALGAAIVSKIPNISSAVTQGVHHHHVRKNRMGFPEKVTYGETSTIAQIVGVSSEFVHLVEHKNQLSSFDLNGEMKEVLKGFSLQIARTFEAKFLQPVDGKLRAG